MSAGRKKVIVRKLSGEWVSGYLPPTDFVQPAGLGIPGLGILGLDGKVTDVRLAEVKWICFVRDFQSGDLASPEQLWSKVFSRRPRAQGLWVRVRLKDHDMIEGLVKNDASLLDSNGLFLIPPDTRSNAQRIFLPRLAIKELEILAVVRPVSPRKTPPAAQETLFKPQSGAF